MVDKLLGVIIFEVFWQLSLTKCPLLYVIGGPVHFPIVIATQQIQAWRLQPNNTIDDSK